MKISHNWLKQYLSLNHSVEKIAQILTDIGLEVEGIEFFESVKGGLEGVVIGEIKSVEPHPNADRLKLTKVDVGHAEYLPIVCGASNLAVGQKVPVALVGTTLYPDEKGFKIKKAKIRGEVSEGMICAEDELGLGSDHEGIMVLDEKASVGTLASEYFEISRDTIFEIGLTPNRIDAASHFGVARDLAAFLKLSEDVELKPPSVDQFKEGDGQPVEIVVEDKELCPRYSGLTLTDLKLGPSPDWLRNALQAIEVKPINNVVDVTNYVLHELGQPLHAFDLSKISGNKILVKTVKEHTPFITLDQKERKLSSSDLMICNSESPMCLAGIFGGADSGVNSSTTSIFLESAYFNPVCIRKSAKRHALNTDASFRYERGTDPNIAVYALKRAALLLQEVAGGKVSSSIIDVYPQPIEPTLIQLKTAEVERIIGKKITMHLMQSILENLDFKILHREKNEFRIQVPTYRVDVTRPIDVIEEILRIYGYNNISIPDQLRMSINYRNKLSSHQEEQKLANFLSSKGYSEIFNNSLSNPKHYQSQENLVRMLNPLSQETEILRKSMLFGGLQAIAYNLNRKRDRLKFYEFGKTYWRDSAGKFVEKKVLALWVCGYFKPESWMQQQTKVNFFHLKATVEDILERIGLNDYEQGKLKVVEEADENIFDEGIALFRKKHELIRVGEISPSILKNMELNQAVFYAELNWDIIVEYLKKKEIKYRPISKFPPVRRDLTLLLDNEIEFEQLKKTAFQSEQHLLRSVNLFDVYQGQNLPKEKKSYSLSFVFQDQKNTLTDQKINRIMDRLIQRFTENYEAQLR